VDGKVVHGDITRDWLTVTNIGSGRHAVWWNADDKPSTATLRANRDASGAGGGLLAGKNEPSAKQ
jgi:hypothetical protein